MSTIDPVIINNYSIYFDRVVTFRPLGRDDVGFIELLYRDGSRLELVETELSAFLLVVPDTFLRFDYYDMWINDSYIKFMHIKWSPDLNGPVLQTFVDTIEDPFEEYYDSMDLPAILQARVDQAKRSNLDTLDEITSALQTGNYLRVTVSETEPLDPQIGDLWVDIS